MVYKDLCSTISTTDRTTETLTHFGLRLPLQSICNGLNRYANGAEWLRMLCG